MRAYTTPLLISDMGVEGEHCRALTALPLRAGVAGASYDERWVQRLIHANPLVLPVGQIEPALADAASVCMELPLACGYLDNLLMTADGGLVLVETKLWRNPEARRAVVGQVLDYAKDLSRWGYEELQAAVRIARKAPGLQLYRYVCGADTASEQEGAFIDAVSRNLRLGRFLLLIVGDGITESTEQLADFLQRHIGLHFTLGLVELSLWRVPDTQSILVQPRILARTVQIERAVVRIEASGAEALVRIEPAAPNTTQRTTITTEQFFESLGAVDPVLPARLKAFLRDLEQRGVYAEHKVMLTLKWRSPESREFNLGVIDPQGRVFTDQAHSAAAAIGKIDAVHQYKAALARLIPGSRIELTERAMGTRLITPIRPPPLARLLDRAVDWLEAIDACLAALGTEPESDAMDAASQS